MRIAVLTTSYPLARESVSGIFVYRLLNSLPQDLQVRVITPCPAAWPDSGNPTHIPVTCFRYAPRRWQVLAHQPGGIPAALRANPLNYLLLPAFLVSMLIVAMRATKSIDLIHANWSISGVIAGIAGKLSSRPVITTLRGSDVDLAQKSALYKFVLRMCMCLSTRVVAVSQTLLDAVIEITPSHAAKMHMIHNGVSEDLLAQEKINDAAGRLRITTIGNLIPDKGMDTVLHSVQRVSKECDVALTIIGDGPEMPALRKQARDLGMDNQVHFTGQIAPQEIAGYLARTDIFVLASLHEGRPNVVLEAFAAGLAVVASDIAGINELVENNVTGLRFTAGDPADLARKITQLHDNRPQLASLGQGARSYIRQHKLTWSSAGQQYADLYRQVLNQT